MIVGELIGWIFLISITIAVLIEFFYCYVEYLGRSAGFNKNMWGERALILGWVFVSLCFVFFQLFEKT